MEARQGRIEAVDVAKGIGVITVVVGHIPELFRTPLANVICSFHMPLFFFLSGLLYGAVRRPTGRSIRQQIASRLVPYATFGLLAIAVTFTLAYAKQRNVDLIALNSAFGSFLIGKPSSGLILWFFPCLLVVELLGARVLSIRRIEIRWLCCIIGAVGGMLLSPWNAVIPWSFDIAMVALPLWVMGSEASGVIANAERLVQPRQWLAVVSVVLAWISIQLFLLGGGDVDMRTENYGNAAKFYYGAIAGTAVVYLVSCLLRRNRLLSLLGRASFVIYPVHTIILRVALAFAALFLPEFNVGSPAIIAARVVFALSGGVAIFIVAQRFPWMRSFFTGK